MKKSSILSGVLLLIFILTACGGGNAPASTPTVDSSAVAAVVSTMMAGVPTVTPLPQPTATSTPEPSTVLPRSLYYLAQDANGKGQIYRLGRDGTTITQITSEPDGIIGFDISSADGTIAYIVENNLVAVDATGGNHRVLVNTSNSEIQGFPVWSPDGKTIAYNLNGMNLFSIETGKSRTLLSNEGISIPTAESFSPDGSKLILSINHRIAVYDIASGSLFIPDRTGGFGNLNNVSWLYDSKHIFIFSSFAGGISYGISIPGLWRYNTVDGTGGTLLGAGNDQTGKDCVQAPRQDIDGNLIYLYARNETVCEAPPLALVRSGSDGITNRIVLRPETFNVEYAMWTPDGDAVLILQNKGTNFAFANMILVPVNASLPVVTIMSDTSKISGQLRWGP
jgi:Tol biopolymer transport system component